MQNVNYDLLKLLKCTQDIIWRLERHYVDDAKTAQCHSVVCLESILEDEHKHASALLNEIKMRMDAGIFD